MQLLTANIYEKKGLAMPFCFPKNDAQYWGMCKKCIHVLYIKTLALAELCTELNYFVNSHFIFYFFIGGGGGLHFLCLRQSQLDISFSPCFTFRQFNDIVHNLWQYKMADSEQSVPVGKNTSDGSAIPCKSENSEIGKTLLPEAESVNQWIAFQAL